MHVVAHRSRDTDTTGRTFSLKSCRNVHCVPVKVSPVCNRVANVDPNAEADGAVRRLIAIMVGHLLLHLHRTAHRTVDAVEHDEQEIAPSLDELATVLLYRRVYQVAAERTQPFERAYIIQSDQAAVADHIGIDDGDQLSPIGDLPIRSDALLPDIVDGPRSHRRGNRGTDHGGYLPPMVAPGER